MERKFGATSKPQRRPIFAIFGNYPIAGVGGCDLAVTAKWVVTSTPHMNSETVPL